MTKATRRALGASILAFALFSVSAPMVAYAASGPSRQSPIPAPAAAADSPVKAKAAAASVSGSSPITTTARRGEGVIAITSRMCGSATAWRGVAKANGIYGPIYLVRLGQRITVTCSQATVPRKASKSSGSANSTTSSGAAWRLPLTSFRLSSCYGPRWGAQHRGLDLAAAHGSTVRAVHAGVVTRAGWIWGGYGISVVIRHGDGTWSHYAHLSREGVSIGQHVGAGQAIGRVGSTGDSTGPHLHLEIARSAAVLGSQINPAPFLRIRGVRIGC